ncbi:MAG: 4Fe-4S binding protein, partial [Anaeroplasmataceae bacterium]
TCEAICPVSCISEVDGGKRRIDEDQCIDCGACAGACPVECIAPAE